MAENWRPFLMVDSNLIYPSFHHLFWCVHCHVGPRNHLPLAHDFLTDNFKFSELEELGNNPPSSLLHLFFLFYTTTSMLDSNYDLGVKGFTLLSPNVLLVSSDHRTFLHNGCSLSMWSAANLRQNPRCHVWSRSLLIGQQPLSPRWCKMCGIVDADGWISAASNSLQFNTIH